MNKFSKTFTLLASCVAAAGISACGLVGAQRLEPGWAAVKIDYANGGARTDIPSGGFLQYNPLTERIAEYPIGQESLVMVRSAQEGKVTGDDSVECRDQHGIPVHIDTTVFWRIDPQRIADMFVLRPSVPLVGKTINDGIDGIVVRRLVRGTMQDQCSPLNYGDIFGSNRASYVVSVSQALGCPTGLKDDPLASVDPLKRVSDPLTTLGKEFIICDKFQMGEIYLDSDQQKAFSEQATAQQAAITAAAVVDQRRQEALAAEQVALGAAKAVQAKADGDAYAVRVAADAVAYDVAARQKALAAAPEVRSYDVALAQANHPSLVNGASTQIQVPLPTPAAR